MPRSHSLASAERDAFRADDESDEIFAYKVKVLRAVRIWADRNGHCTVTEQGLKAVGILQPDPTFNIQVKFDEDKDWVDLSGVNANQLSKLPSRLQARYYTDSFDHEPTARDYARTYERFLNETKQEEWNRTHITSKADAGRPRETAVAAAMGVLERLQARGTPQIEIPTGDFDPVAFAEQARAARAAHEAELANAEQALATAREIPDAPVERWSASRVPPYPALRIVRRLGANNETELWTTLPATPQKAATKKAAAKKAAEPAKAPAKKAAAKKAPARRKAAAKKAPALSRSRRRIDDAKAVEGALNYPLGHVKLRAMELPVGVA